MTFSGNFMPKRFGVGKSKVDGAKQPPGRDGRGGARRSKEPEGVRTSITASSVNETIILEQK